MTHPIPNTIKTKILKLKRIEMELGHIPPEPRSLKELEKRMHDPAFKSQCEQLEVETETLFAEIGEELAALGFSPENIALHINTELSLESGLKYCNEAEVKEALGIK